MDDIELAVLVMIAVMPMIVTSINVIKQAVWYAGQILRGRFLK